jgi:hypothetical protein
MFDERGQKGAVSLEGLKGPSAKTPEERFLEDANTLVDQSAQKIAIGVLGKMRSNDYAEIKGLAEHDSDKLTKFEKMDRVRAAADSVSRREVQAAGSIYPDFEKALLDHGVKVAKPGDPSTTPREGLDPAHVKSAYDNALHERVSAVVEKVMVKAYEEFKDLCESRAQEAQTRADREAARRAESQRLAAEQAREAQARAEREAARYVAQQAENNRLALEREQLARQQARDAREQEKDARATQRTPDQLNADQCRDDLQNILRTGQTLGTQELVYWISKGLGVAKDSGRLAEKLKNTGLIDFDTGPDGPDFGTIRVGQTKPNFFRSIRTTSLLCWGATITASALTIGAGVATGGFGIVLGCAASFLVNAGNMGVQSLLKKRFNDRFTNTWREIQSEIGVLDVSRAPALTGAMYLLVDKYSPVMLRKNRTKFWLPGKPSSTGAVLDHLKEACSAGLNNISQNTEGYYKGMDVKEKLNLANGGLQNLEQRWKWHFKQSDWFGATLTTASGLASLSWFSGLAGF